MIEAADAVGRAGFIRHGVAEKTGFPAQAGPFLPNVAMHLMSTRGRAPVDRAAREVHVAAAAIGYYQLPGGRLPQKTLFATQRGPFRLNRTGIDDTGPRAIMPAATLKHTKLFTLNSLVGQDSHRKMIRDDDPVSAARDSRVLICRENVRPAQLRGYAGRSTGKQGCQTPKCKHLP